MKLTKQETSMVKVAAAYAAPRLVKKASLQQKLAAYGIGLTKKAETNGQALARFADKKLNDFGDWLDKAWKTVQLNAGKTPNQVNPPSDAEWQKGREIYGSGDRGNTTHVPGTPLWEKTKYDIKRDKQYRKSDMLRNARFNARINKLNQEGRQSYFDGNLGLAKGTTDPLTRDMYLRDINLLPPRNDGDKSMIDIMFPNK